jgi:hypothetical protein
MKRGSLLLAVGLLAAGASGCATTDSVVYDRDVPEQRLASMADGVVMRVDEPNRIVILDNGRMYRVAGDRAILVNGQPVVLGTVRPGQRVTIVSGTPVIYQDGQYVTTSTPPPATATVRTPGPTAAPPPGAVVPAPPAGTVVAAPPPGTVVTAPPGGTVVTAPPGAVIAVPGAGGSTIRMHGRVADVEGDGNVKVRLSDGSAFEFRPPAGTAVRKDDAVMIDMTFGAAAPSALPR